MLEVKITHDKSRYIHEKKITALHDRVCDHIDYIRTQKTVISTGNHLKFPRLSLAHITATILEKFKASNI